MESESGKQSSIHAQKREELYQVIQDAKSCENKKASHAGLPLPYNIMVGDMNAAPFKQDVQRAKLEATHQKLIKTLHLHATAPDEHPHRQYNLRHRMDSSQDCTMDGILIPESMYRNVTLHRDAGHIR